MSHFFIFIFYMCKHIQFIRPLSQGHLWTAADREEVDIKVQTIGVFIFRSKIGLDRGPARTGPDRSSSVQSSVLGFGSFRSSVRSRVGQVDRTERPRMRLIFYFFPLCPTSGTFIGDFETSSTGYNPWNTKLSSIHGITGHPPNVTGPLPSPQKVNLKGCAAPPFISPGPSHLSSDVGLFVLTVTLGIFLCMVGITRQ